MTTFKTQDADDFATTQPGISFDSADESWTISTGVLVSSKENDGVYGSGNGQTLANHGSILGALFGVELKGDHAAVSNDANARIIAIDEGVFVNGNGSVVDNQGSIVSLTEDGVTFGANSSHVTLDNSGMISGRDSGVLQTSLSAGAAIHNTGLISGNAEGITVFTAEGLTTTIDNAAGATIRGGDAAILIEVGAIVFANHGTVIGNIDATLATGPDVIVNRGSITSGAVFLGPGDDVFIGTGGSAVTVLGDQGNDRLVGGSGGDTFYGGAGDDRLVGAGGRDRLDGGTGSDTLTGGRGQDQFVFDSELNALSNIDRITDFVVHVDKILLGDRIFRGIGHSGVLPGNIFHVGPGAHDSDDRIIYDPASGFLIYDANGNHHGGAVHFATLAPHLALSHADFMIYEMPVA